MLLRTRALAIMLAGTISQFSAQEVTSIAMSLKNIVDFESPRVLI